MIPKSGYRFSEKIMLKIFARRLASIQIRTALVANADSTGFWIVLSAMAATTAMTAAAMQAVMKTRMVDPSEEFDSLGLYSILRRATQP
jgi:hypothetical protein